MNYKIREIRSGEAAALKKLACPNFSTVERLFMPKPELGVVAESEDGNIAGGAFLVVVNAGGKKIGCVDIVFVLKEYRGSGVAKKLYQAAVETLYQYGCETVMALVRGDNSQSLLRFESVGLHRISLSGLCRQIGLSAVAALFVKTAALACATGCWILCDKSKPQNTQENVKNVLHMFFANGILLIGGAALGLLLHRGSMAFWTFPAALFLLAVITFGETIGKMMAGGSWHYALPEGGYVPAAIVALLGGFYPMSGHWYLIKRENTTEYRRRMAAPAKGAWLLLIAATIVCGIFQTLHPFLLRTAGLGRILLMMYMLPFYPFDTYGGRRIWEDDKRIYGVLIVLSIIALMGLRYR